MRPLIILICIALVVEGGRKRKKDKNPGKNNLVKEPKEKEIKAFDRPDPPEIEEIAGNGKRLPGRPVDIGQPIDMMKPIELMKPIKLAKPLFNPESLHKLPAGIEDLDVGSSQPHPPDHDPVAALGGPDHLPARPTPIHRPNPMHRPLNPMHRPNHIHRPTPIHDSRPEPDVLVIPRPERLVLPARPAPSRPAPEEQGNPLPFDLQYRPPTYTITPFDADLIYPDTALQATSNILSVLNKLTQPDMLIQELRSFMEMVKTGDDLLDGDREWLCAVVLEKDMLTAIQELNEHSYSVMFGGSDVGEDPFSLSEVIGIFVDRFGEGLFDVMDLMTKHVLMRRLFYSFLGQTCTQF